MFGPDPPDDFVLVPVHVDVLSGDLGLTDAAHPRDDLGRRDRPSAEDEVSPQRLQFRHPAGEVQVTGGDLCGPDLRVGAGRRGPGPPSDARVRRYGLGRTDPRRHDVVFRLPGRLPQGQEHRGIPGQRLDYFFQERPPGYPRIAEREHVVHGRRTDPAAPGPGGDLPHGRPSGLEMQFVEPVVKLGDRAGRGRVAVDRRHRLVLPMITAVQVCQKPYTAAICVRVTGRAHAPCTGVHRCATDAQAYTQRTATRQSRP